MWQTKAHRLIAAMCRASYLACNTLPSGAMRRRHVPYSVPALADALIDCLKTNDEVRAKAIFLGYAMIGREYTQ